MYPNELFWGLDLYTIMIALGFLAALILFRVLADRAKMRAGVQNLCVYAGLASLLGGYLFAVLFQAIYNAIETGRFSVGGDTGATFYGGLIGGVLTFLGVYFLVGHFRLPAGEARKQIPRVFNIGICGVVIAHAFGRIGCLFAGCCHGHETHAWYGIWNADLGYRTVPTQLFEALFLFALCAFLSWNDLRGKRQNFALYLVLYGVWRFGIVFFRADDRGKTIIPFLTPSQLVAVLMVVAGTALLIRHLVIARRAGKPENGESAHE